MEPKFNTSFIPKKSLQADTSAASRDKYIGRRSTQYGPGFFLTLLLFIASIIASIGVFGYTTIVDKRIEGYKTTLNEQQSRFDSNVVDELIRTESRIDSASTLVANHTVLTQLFSKLEMITLRKVQYLRLIYVNEPNSKPIMTLLGTTKDFKSVAQQTTTFRLDEHIQNPVMVELGRDDLSEEVTFAVDASIDDTLISFSEALKDERFGKNTFSAPVLPTMPSTTNASSS